MPSKRELTVSEVSPNPEMLKKIGQVARYWQQLACEKKSKASGSSKEIFSDSATVSKLIAQCMERPKETTRIWNKIYICEDVALKGIQAIALVYASYFELKISHMATHPQNIRSSVNQMETTRVEGAARTLVNHLVTTVSSDQQIYLESVKSAYPFYQKFGFETLDSKEYPPDEWGTIPMRLSKEKIQSLTQQVA